MSQGKAASLQKSTRAFSGFSEKDVSAINGSVSHTTKGELPIHPNLANTTNIHNQGGPGDWRVSTEVSLILMQGLGYSWLRCAVFCTSVQFQCRLQVLKHERDAALEKLDTRVQVTSKTTKMTMTQGRNYKTPSELEKARADTIRRLKREGKYDWRQLHTYRMPEAGTAIGEEEPEEEQEWDGEITFGKRRPGGVQTRTRWNYASPT